MTTDEIRAAKDAWPTAEEIKMAERIVAVLRERMHKTPGVLDVYVEARFVKFVVAGPDRDRGGRWIVTNRLNVRLFNSMYDATSAN